MPKNNTTTGMMMPPVLGIQVRAKSSVKTKLLSIDTERQIKVDNEDDSQSVNFAAIKSLWQHQREAIKWMLQREMPSSRGQSSGGILGDEMGLGKTASILGLVILDKVLSSAPQRPAPTLIVVPSSLLHKWRAEWHKHFEVGENSALLYHGESKNKCVKWSRRQQQWLIDPRAQLVVTTYGQVLADHKSLSKARTEDPSYTGCSTPGNYRFGILFNTVWHRIVLDESHMSIQNSKTQRYNALSQLSSLRRWAVTGTVHTNSWEDVASTCIWISVPPYNQPHWWSNNWTKAEAIRLWRFGDARWHRETTEQGFRYSDCKRKTLPYILIRHKDLIRGLPSITVENIKIEFKPGELLAYDVWACNMKRALSSYLRKRKKPSRRVREVDAFAAEEESDKSNVTFSIIAKFIIRLRQFCNHTKLVRGAASTRQYASLMGALQESTEHFCNECSAAESESSGRELACAHWVCFECYAKTSELENPNCSLCTDFFADQYADSHATNYLKPLYTGSPDDKCTHCLGFGHVRSTHPECALNKPHTDTHDYGIVGYSGKFQAILSTLDFWKRHDRQVKDQTPFKVVIFSQWVSSFNLLEPVLAENGYSSLRFTGEITNLQRRNEILEQFANDTSIPILLCGLKAGGVGLDLVMANRVIFLEPWFNLPVEKQAADRTHRIGQTRPVHVVKFTVKYSIEDWMLDLQQKKLAESDWIKGEWKLGKTGKSSPQFSKKDLNSLLFYLCRSYYKDHRTIHNK